MKMSPNYGSNLSTAVSTAVCQLNPAGCSLSKIGNQLKTHSVDTQLSIISIEKSETDSASRSESEEIQDPNDASQQANRSWWRTLSGLALAVLAATCLALSSVMVKQLDGILSPAELGVYRFAAIILFTLPVLGNNFTNMRSAFGPRGLVWLLVIRSLACGSALIFKYYSYQNVPLGDGTAIALATPTLVSVLAWIFLKEPFGWCHVASLLITAVGVGTTSRIDLL